MSGILDRLRAAGYDPDASLPRFAGKVEMMEKFLRMFPGDPSMGDLTRAIGDQDWEKAQHAVHTLKGVSGTVGLNLLFNDAKSVNDAFREGRVEDALALYETLKTRYAEAVSLIQAP